MGMVVTLGSTKEQEEGAGLGWDRGATLNTACCVITAHLELPWSQQPPDGATDTTRPLRDTSKPLGCTPEPSSAPPPAANFHPQSTAVPSAPHLNPYCAAMDQHGGGSGPPATTGHQLLTWAARGPAVVSMSVWMWMGMVVPMAMVVPTETAMPVLTRLPVPPLIPIRDAVVDPNTDGRRRC